MGTDHIIIINGGSHAQIRQGLSEWIELYAQDLNPDLKFQLTTIQNTKHLIKIHPDLDNDRFSFLVNYLNYPENNQYSVEVEGFTTVKNDLLSIPGKEGQRILLFIPETNTEYDNVYGVTPDNEVIKIDFGGRVTRMNISKGFHEPDLKPFESGIPKLIKVKPHTLERATQSARTDRYTNRLYWLTGLSLGILSCAYIILDDHGVLVTVGLILGIGLSGWFLADYKMLQSNSHYFGAVVLSLGFLAGNYILIISNNQINSLSLSKIGGLLPLCFLMIQRPVRLAFKKLLNREPVVDNPAPSIPDFIYSMIIIMLPVILCLMILA